MLLSTKSLSTEVLKSLQKKREKRDQKREKWEQEKLAYADLEKRIASFTNKAEFNWPHQKPTPEECAAAGLFFTPALKKKDRCKCYVCGVKLSNWLSTDDPKLEHRRWKPSCELVQSWTAQGPNPHVNYQQKVKDLWNNKFGFLGKGHSGPRK
jgi:hypothetical protein